MKNTSKEKITKSDTVKSDEKIVTDGKNQNIIKTMAMDAIKQMRGKLSFFSKKSKREFIDQQERAFNRATSNLDVITVFENISHWAGLYMFNDLEVIANDFIEKARQTRDTTYSLAPSTSWDGIGIISALKTLSDGRIAALSKINDKKGILHIITLKQYEGGVLKEHHGMVAVNNDQNLDLDVYRVLTHCSENIFHSENLIACIGKIDGENKVEEIDLKTLQQCTAPCDQGRVPVDLYYLNDHVKIFLLENKEWHKSIYYFIIDNTDTKIQIESYGDNKKNFKPKILILENNQFAVASKAGIYLYQYIEGNKDNKDNKENKEKNTLIKLGILGNREIIRLVKLGIHILSTSILGEDLGGEYFKIEIWDIITRNCIKSDVIKSKKHFDPNIELHALPDDQTLLYWSKDYLEMGVLDNTFETYPLDIKALFKEESGIVASVVSQDLPLYLAFFPTGQFIYAFSNILGISAPAHIVKEVNLLRIKQEIFQHTTLIPPIAEIVVSYLYKTTPHFFKVKKEVSNDDEKNCDKTLKLTAS